MEVRLNRNAARVYERVSNPLSQIKLIELSQVQESPLRTFSCPSATHRNLSQEYCTRK